MASYQIMHNGPVMTMTNAPAYPVELDARLSGSFMPAPVHVQQHPSWQNQRANSAPMPMGPATFLPPPAYFADPRGRSRSRGGSSSSLRRDSVSSNCSNSSAEGRLATLRMMSSSWSSLPGMDTPTEFPQTYNVWAAPAPAAVTPPPHAGGAVSMSMSPVERSPQNGPVMDPYSRSDPRPASFRPLGCFNYIRDGYCADGDKCRFEHPADVQEERSMSKAPCIQFMKTGTCAMLAAGKPCPYRHHSVENVPEPKMDVAGFEAVAEKDPKSKDSMCFEYANNGVCRYGKFCRYEHIQKVCYQYVNSGKCNYPNCKYLHTRDEKFKLCPEFVKNESCSKEGCRLKHELPNHKRQMNPVHRDSRIGVRIQKAAVTPADLSLRRASSGPTVPPSVAIRRHRSAMVRRAASSSALLPRQVNSLPSKLRVYNQPPSPISSNLGPTPILRPMNTLESVVEDVAQEEKEDGGCSPLHLTESIGKLRLADEPVRYDGVNFNTPEIIPAELINSEEFDGCDEEFDGCEEPSSKPILSAAAALMLAPRSSRSFSAMPVQCAA